MDLIAEAGSLSSSDLSQKKAELKLKHRVSLLYMISLQSLPDVYKYCSTLKALFRPACLTRAVF